MNSKQMFTCIGMLMVTCALVAPKAIPQSGDQRHDKAEVLLEAAQHKQLVDGDLDQAIQMYKKILSQYAADRPVAAKALVEMGGCYEKLGQGEAQKAYERASSADRRPCGPRLVSGWAGSKLRRPSPSDRYFVITVRLLRRRANLSEAVAQGPLSDPAALPRLARGTPEHPEELEEPQG